VTLTTKKPYTVSLLGFGKPTAIACLVTCIVGKIGKLGRKSRPFPASTRCFSDPPFFSEHPGGTQFVFCDGHTTFLPEVIDINVYQSLSTRDGMTGGTLKDVQTSGSFLKPSGTTPLSRYTTGVASMRISLALLISACLVVCVGCGPRWPTTAPVGGKVTFAGKPVTEGTIIFWSSTGGTLATGQIGADGSYRLTTHPDLDGAVLGAHRVTIKAVNVIKLAPPNKASADRERLGPLGGFGSTERLEWRVPPRYEDRNTSPLTAEVKSGANTIDFNLPAEK
jgi:prepilin-type processing-associated H-X9-DG protein